MRKYLIALALLFLMGACGNSKDNADLPDSYYKHVDSIVVTPERAKQIIDSTLNLNR